MIKKIYKSFCKLILCIICITTVSNSCFAADIPNGNIGDYGNWLDSSNREEYISQIKTDSTTFQKTFSQHIDDYTSNLDSSKYVPIEAKLGLVFIEALSSLDNILQNSLVKFVIIFLFCMYGLWIAIEGYNLIKSTTDPISVMQNIATKGIIISVWIAILYFNKTADLFNVIITPIIYTGTYISDLILNTLAGTANITIPDTCNAIRHYVIEETTANSLLIDPSSVANIMCVPSRISFFFYKAIGIGFKWFINGFGHSLTSVIVGAVSVFLFIKCVFKFAFMSLGVVADLFLSLLMLPFTALAEGLPQSSEKGYLGQIFNGLLQVFNAKKLSDQILVFINAAIYFVSLSIVIAICAIILAGVTNLTSSSSVEVHYTSILLGGALVLYLATKADNLAKQIGGNVDNSFGEQMYTNVKIELNKIKNLSEKAIKNLIKNKK